MCYSYNCKLFAITTCHLCKYRMAKYKDIYGKIDDTDTNKQPIETQRKQNKIRKAWKRRASIFISPIEFLHIHHSMNI